MTKLHRPTSAEIVRRLIAVKAAIQGMKDAMPTLAAELRRESCEEIDDLIKDIA